MVPKLRLSSFKDDKSSRWSLANLGKLVEFKKGKGISKSDISNDGTYPCVRYGELYTIYNEKIDKVQSKTNCDPSEHVISKSGDILIPASGETAVDIARASSIFRDDVILGGDINILTPKSNSLNSLFLSYSIVGKKKMELAKMAQGNSVVHLYSSQLKTLEIWLPLIDEQTRIAYFLSSIDEKIALLNKQYDLLCQYKKGMMQKIFSQELRFKNNNGGKFPKWDMRKFSDFFTIGSSKRVLQDSWVNEGVPFYRTRELVSLSKKEKFKSEIFITEDNYAYLKHKYGIPAIGDFLVSGVGTLGIIHQIKNDNPFYFKDGNVLWFRKNNEINSDFFYQVFNSPKVITQVVDHAAITTVGTYTIENAKKTKFMCPSLDEQTKIANFLSAIDDKIAVKKAELDKLKTWKQGLLQQMFV
ncbi:restriction endonuclease subunit S [Enterobacter hormaechei subsp. steigerwaltii]